MLVRIASPKAKRVFARRQHARIEDSNLIAFLQHWTRGRARSSKIFAGGAAAFRKCYDATLRFFEVPSAQSVGYTPASQRSGGATAYYLGGRPLADIAWMGRWTALKTLEIYIQEVAGLTALTDLPIHVQNRIRRFGQGFAAILASTLLART